jgi:hypothetical protein
MQNFLPWHGLAGGVLIGLSAAIFLLTSGRITGISGIIENTVQPVTGKFVWSLAYLVGLPVGALLVATATPSLLPANLAITPSVAMLALGGLLVGFGARLGGGCTSGHGICGLPRFSTRSFIAVGTFMATAALTVFVARHVLAIG